jgi:hypothetical protein
MLNMTPPAIGALPQNNRICTLWRSQLHTCHTAQIGGSCAMGGLAGGGKFRMAPMR